MFWSILSCNLTWYWSSVVYLTYYLNLPLKKNVFPISFNCCEKIDNERQNQEIFGMKK